MLVMGLQWAFNLVAIFLVPVTLRIGRYRSSTDPLHPAAWTLTGIAFVPYALCMTLQHGFGTWAMVAGNDSAVMARYMEWSPALNHSRTFLLVAFFALLTWFTVRRTAPTPRTWAGVAAGLGAGFAFGVWMGLHEGALVVATHFTRVAIWDALELAVVLATLFLGLVTNRVDRYLWALLAVFGAVVAFNILFYAALSLMGDPRVWSPPPAMMGFYRLALVLVMLAVAMRRLSLARRGVPVAGLLGGPRGAASLSVG